MVAQVDQELRVADARLRFRDEGTGPAAILIHGWALDLEMWEPQARALRDSLRIIRHDRRGFGLSSGHPSLAHDISDLRALCAHLRLESVALLGMSQGARVAAHIAAGNRPLVSCVVFDGAPAGTIADGETTDNDIPVATYRALVRSGGVSEFRKEWCRHPLAQLRTGDGATRELLEGIRARYRALDLAVSAAEESPLPAPLARSIRSPALIISGELDLESRIRTADALAGCLPWSERAVISGAAHMPNLDNPLAYNESLRRFLARFAR
jgi:pimeloyl-ACP methyl ester carboxylesterase